MTALVRPVGTYLARGFTGEQTWLPLCAGLVIATVLVVGALSYAPVLALGPVIEHLALR